MFKLHIYMNIKSSYQTIYL